MEEEINILNELKKVVPSINKGLKIAQNLLVISFIIGCCLLVTSILLIIFDNNVKDSYKYILLGGGLADTLMVLLYYPIEKIQLNKSSLALYQAIFSSWLFDIDTSSKVFNNQINENFNFKEYSDYRKQNIEITKELLNFLILDKKTSIKSFDSTLKKQEKNAT